VWDAQVAVGWNPFPGPSDAFYVLLGPCLGAGVVSLVWGQPRTRRAAVLLDGLGFALALLALTLATYLPRRGGMTSFTLAVLAAYPTFLLTVTALLVVVALERREPPSRTLGLLLFALLTQGLLWMRWNLETLDNTLGDAKVINYLFSYGALCLGVAVALFEPSRHEVEGVWARAYALASRLLPLGLVIAASVAGMLSAGATYPVRWSVELCMGGVILVAVLRQSLLLEERERRLAAEARFREVEQRLSQSQRLESLGTLAGGIAHDFNNVLTGILGHVEYLSHVKSLSPDVVESVEGLRAGALRARDVTRRILAFSRHEATAPEAIDALALVDEVVALLRAALPARHVLKVAGDEHLYLRGSPAQIHQVLMNLGTNASHAIGARPGCIEFSVHARAITAPRGTLLAGSYVELSVIDDGEGMDPATRARAFEPFFTTKTREHGTGLGLSVVHGIVTEHGGGIELESKRDNGTTVRILLPATERPELTPEPEVAVSSDAPVTRSFLIVDDEPAIGGVLKRLLGMMGQPAESVTSPQAALALVEEQPERFWLVVTDMSMPTMSGIELAEALRHRAPSLVLVLSSGTDFVVAGTPFDDVLPKPYTATALTELIARHRPPGVRAPSPPS
ncbi:MAG TPA: ATP-binding protein, partial [Polyangiaceae bacterium]|nr:ATP-binding protein [Polyangiaceae bacterium]